MELLWLSRRKLVEQKAPSSVSSCCVCSAAVKLAHESDESASELSFSAASRPRNAR